MKQRIKYFIVILVTVLVLIGSLFLTSCIPRELIHDNMLESAEEMATHDLFEVAIGGMDSSILHYYADAITLNIIYNIDSNHPVSSVISAMYYTAEGNWTNRDLLDCVTNNLKANQEYARYWHGGITIVRPLLILFNARQIRIIMYIILVLLLGILYYLLYKRKSISEIVILSIALLMTFTFLTPLVLEYIWMILLMLVFSIVALVLQNRQSESALLCMFAIDGIATAFFDFLTIETVTLLVPLLLVLMQRRRTKEFEKQDLVFTVRSLISWGTAFVIMWSTKWILTMVVMKWNMGTFLTDHVEERSVGSSSYISQFEYIRGAIGRNISMLFPINIPGLGVFAGIAIILILAYLLYVYRRNKWDKKYVFAMTVLSMVPFIRYLVMHAHSYEHYFFTYRALLSTIVAWGAIFVEIVDVKNNKRGKRR